MQVCLRLQQLVLCLIIGTNVNALSPKLCSCLLDLSHQFRMRVRYVIEGEDSPAELEQKICAKRDEGPERDLCLFSLNSEIEGLDVIPQGQPPSETSRGMKKAP